MTAGGAAGSGRTRLMFHWPERTYLSFSMIGFFLLSAVLHGFGFFLFQVDYPRSAPLAPPPAQVYVLSPTSEENKALLRWIDAQDPSLISQPHEVIPPAVFDLPYSPSYSEVHAQPKPAPDENAPKSAFPPAQEVLSVVQSALPQKAMADRDETPGQPTELRFSSPLTARAVVSGLPLSVERKSTASLQPSSFLIGVTGEGEVRFLFARGGPGDDKEMDAGAEAALRKVRFTPGESAMTWSTATIYWGIDAYQTPVEAK